MSGQDVQSIEHDEDEPPRNRLQYAKRGPDALNPATITVPTFADILCAMYGDGYLRRSSLVFGRCYERMWSLSRGKKPVPRWMLEHIAKSAESPKSTADFIRNERSRFEARLARRLELRKFAGRWAGLFLSGAYDLPISTLPKKPKSRRSKPKKS